MEYVITISFLDLGSVFFRKWRSLSYDYSLHIYNKSINQHY
nr:MAG TPA: hypothetical protein [Caudoviricetes sp.]